MNFHSTEEFKTENFNLSGPRHIAATDWNNTQHRISIVASLVQGVYVLEHDRKHLPKGHQALAPPWWNSFNFQLRKELKDDFDSSIFGAIYEYESPPNTSRELQPPRYVIAFRGTQIKWRTIKQDLKLDFHHVFNQRKFGKSFRLEKAMEVVPDFVTTAGAENVWLAGHSLGSATALVVGRNMVRIGFRLESYLFNPPFSALPLELIKSRKLKLGARIMGNLMKVVLSVTLSGHLHRPQEEKDAFNMLSDWTPHLFVNPKDPICTEYIGYFEHREKMKSIGATRLGNFGAQNAFGSIVSSALGRSAEPHHMLPSAYLVTNTNVAENNLHYDCLLQAQLAAHRLAQWWTQGSNLQFNLYTGF